jgi:hypothetical protein
MTTTTVTRRTIFGFGVNTTPTELPKKPGWRGTYKTVNKTLANDPYYNSIKAGTYHSEAWFVRVNKKWMRVISPISDVEVLFRKISQHGYDYEYVTDAVEIEVEYVSDIGKKKYRLLASDELVSLYRSARFYFVVRATGEMERIEKKDAMSEFDRIKNKIVDRDEAFRKSRSNWPDGRPMLYGEKMKLVQVLMPEEMRDWLLRQPEGRSGTIRNLIKEAMKNEGKKNQ